MAFIGNQPVEQYSSIAKQDITGNGGTTYTLNATVTSPEDIEVFINNVRQEPSTSYTVSGTTLTLTEALLSTDDCYVVYQGRTVGTKAPGDNTVGTGKIQANAVTAAKLATSLDFQNITIKGGSNNAMTVASDGKVNFPQIITNPSIPCFHVYNDNANFSSTSVSKWGVNVAVINNGNHFSLSSNRFTAPVAGHYFMAWHALFRNVSSGFRVWWYKNGAINTNPSDTAASDIYMGYGSGIESTGSMSGIFNLSAGEYIEVYYQSGGSGDIYGNDNMHNGWTGHLIG